MWKVITTNRSTLVQIFHLPSISCCGFSRTYTYKMLARRVNARVRTGILLCNRGRIAVHDNVFLKKHIPKRKSSFIVLLSLLIFILHFRIFILLLPKKLFVVTKFIIHELSTFSWIGNSYKILILFLYRPIFNCIRIMYIKVSASSTIFQ